MQGRIPVNLSLCLIVVLRVSTILSRSSFSSFMSWIALSRSPRRLCRRRTSVNSPLPISNANSGFRSHEFLKVMGKHVSAEEKTHQHRPRDEQHFLRV